MINLKFVSIFRTLNKNELKNFGKFLNSPCFNTSRKIINLYKILKPYYPEFDSRNLTKETIFEKLYPGKNYSNKQMEKISGEMLNLAEQFIITVRFNKDNFTPQFYLLQELNERKLFNLFKTRLRPVEEKFKSENIFNEWYFLNRYKLEREKIFFFNNSQAAPFHLNDNAQSISDNLTNYFLINILSIYSYMINQSKNAYDFSFRMDFFEQVKNYVESNPVKNVPYVEMFYNSMMLLLHGRKENFENLRRIVSGNYDKIDRIDRLNMYTVLTNYCFRQYNLGNEEYLRIDFEIYNEMLERGAYKANYYLHHLQYKNIVSCALGIKEFGWTKKFIEDYRDKLSAEHRESSYYLCSGLLEFALGNYEKSLESLTKVNMEDITYKFDAKCLVTQIYYELNHHESFYSMLDSYKHLLFKNKLVPAKNKEQHLQFIKFINQINRLKEEYDDLKLHEIKKEISNAESVKNKRWLLEKINEITQ